MAVLAIGHAQDVATHNFGRLISALLRFHFFGTTGTGGISAPCSGAAQASQISRSSVDEPWLAAPHGTTQLSSPATWVCRRSEVARRSEHSGARLRCGAAFVLPYPTMLSYRSSTLIVSPPPRLALKAARCDESVGAASDWSTFGLVCGVCIPWDLLGCQYIGLQQALHRRSTRAAS